MIQKFISNSMIGTFLGSLVFLTGISLVFFFGLLENTIHMSLQSVFLSHQNSIVKDIIEVKKNDFMLCQNELKLSKILMVDIIERNDTSNNKFNMRSVYNSNGKNIEEKLLPFTSKIMQLKTL
jgi:hypothetical protein